MHDAAAALTPLFIENNESYQTLIDEPYFTVIRMDGVYVCQTHLPADLGELHFDLARMGFVGMGAHAEEGVLSIMLRKLGDVPLIEEEVTAGKAVACREELYA
jgi:hypothetical protein